MSRHIQDQEKVETWGGGEKIIFLYLFLSQNGDKSSTGWPRQKGRCSNLAPKNSQKLAAKEPRRDRIEGQKGKKKTDARHQKDLLVRVKRVTPQEKGNDGEKNKEYQSARKRKKEATRVGVTSLAHSLREGEGERDDLEDQNGTL